MRLDTRGTAPSADPGHRRRNEQRLVLAAYLFAIGSAVHIFDHLRRGQGSVTEQLYWAGNVALIVQVVVITLVVTRHRVAPLAAAAAGFPLAVGFAAAHWLPTWSSLSDSFVNHGAAVFSYVASFMEIAGAIAIGVAGLQVLRDSRIGSMSRREPATG
jgi:hypothetical protein